MKKEKLKVIIWITSVLTVIGIGVSGYAYFIEESSMGNLAGAIFAIVSFIVAMVSFATLMKEKEKPPMLLDFNTATRLADERLKKEIDLRDKTIEELKKELAHKDLPQWEQIVRVHLEKGELQKAIESINTDAGDKEAVQKHIRKAQLYITNFQFTEAEQQYKQAIDVLPSFNNYFAIARFYVDLNRFSEATDYYNHCLSLATTLQNRAAVLNCMGVVQWMNNAYFKANASLKEALKLRRELAAKNRDTYLPDVANTLINLGNLQRDKNKYSKAEASYREALKILRELVAMNPDTYLPNVATALHNLGILQMNKNKYSKAEASYKEALKIWREFADKNRDTYLPDVAMTLHNLGMIQNDKKDYSEAEVSYMEALKIWKEFADKNPDAYLPCVATALINLGNLQCNKKDYSEAKASYEEALKIWKEFADKNPDAYLPSVGMVLFNLSIFYQKLSLQYAKEAVEILDKCNNTPEVQGILDKAKQILSFGKPLSRWRAIISLIGLVYYYLVIVVSIIVALLIIIDVLFG